jgi:hypothetical protein
MSGYEVSDPLIYAGLQSVDSIKYPSSGQGNYNYTTAAYQTAVPQYTQAQINQYYAQYHCYPPQPYNIIPDYYPVVTSGYQAPVVAPEYDNTQWQGQSDNIDVPFQGPTRYVPSTPTPIRYLS